MTKPLLADQDTLDKLIDSVSSASLIAELLLAGLVLGFIGYVSTSLANIGNQPFFNLSLTPPTRSNWRPDTTPGAAAYCAGLSELAGSFSDPGEAIGRLDAGRLGYVGPLTKLMSGGAPSP
jgi:hypothetical protein